MSQISMPIFDPVNIATAKLGLMFEGLSSPKCRLKTSHLDRKLQNRRCFTEPRIRLARSLARESEEVD